MIRHLYKVSRRTDRTQSKMKALRLLALAAISLTAALLMVAETPHAQTPIAQTAHPQTPQKPAETSPIAALLARAHAQEQNGRDDLAAQTWRQVLLVDPRNRDALVGMARSAKLAGKDAEANDYINRLRQVDPTNSEILKIQATATLKVQAGQLQQAAKLAQSGHPEEALRIYRNVWGNRPPDGDWALAYYDTEASTEAGRGDAVEGLRALALKYPADQRYNVTLGRILT